MIYALVKNPVDVRNYELACSAVELLEDSIHHRNLTGVQRKMEAWLAQVDETGDEDLTREAKGAIDACLDLDYCFQDNDCPVAEMLRQANMVRDRLTRSVLAACVA